MAIQKLSTDIINKIAAGEVVERPASVVKELVENSLDAGASHIEVELRNGGKDYIRVQDDGSGMNEDDARLSTEQHATSKIAELDDLFSLTSFGFRGEALASISSVSDFVMQTRRVDDSVGVEVHVQNSEQKMSPTSCKTGTKIEVKNLFKNVPARREYLKRDSTEYNHVLDTFTQFALAHSNVGFTLIHNDKQIYNLAATENLLVRIEQLFKKDIADVMMAADFEEDAYAMKGFIGKPHKFSQSRAYQYIFINGRYIKSPVIHKAILQGYSSLLPHGTQPVYVIDLKIDPRVVDVNVHPRKLEVRFSDSQGIFRFIVRAINQILRTNDLNKKIEVPDTPAGAPFGNSSLRGGSRSESTWQSRGLSTNGVIPSQVGTSHQQNSYQSPRMNFGDGGQRVTQKSSQNFSQGMFNGGSSSQDFSGMQDITSRAHNYDLGDWKVLGQIKDSYILVEAGQRGLLIVDQHGAAEGVNYYRLKKEYESGAKTKKQQLLLPLTIDLSLQEFNLVMDHKEDFDKLGFDVEAFGEKTIAVNSVPTIINARDPKKIVDEIIRDIIEQGKAESFTIDYMLKTIACKSAVKFGDRLTLEEQIKIVHDVRNEIDNQVACAHGRPVILELDWEYINRRFERT